MTALDSRPTLTTPTGMLVYDGPAHAPAWFEARRGGITGTDIPKILGDSEYGNALSVWADKRGDLTEDEAGEAAEWGSLLEPIILARWAERTGGSYLPVGVLANAEQPWMRASLDGIAIRCPDGDGPCGLEAKNRSEFVAGRWRDDIPDDVHAQVAWGMAVTGYSHTHVAALIGGNRLRTYRVERDLQVEEWLAAQAREVWAHVLDGTPPVDLQGGDVLRRVLDALHPDRSGVVEVDALTAAGLVREYDDALAAEKAAKARKAAAGSKLVELLGDAQEAEVDGFDSPAFTYRATSKPTHIVKASTYRTLRIGSAYRQYLNPQEEMTS